MAYTEDQSDAISQGNVSIFVTQPISATVFAITAPVLIVPPVWRRVARRAAGPAAATQV